MPWLRGAALKAQAPVAVKLPLAFVTGNEGARGLLEQAGVAVSLCRLDIRDEVVGGNPAGEAAIEICRRWQLDEPRTRASCELNMASPGSAGGGRAGGAVQPSAYRLPVRKAPGYARLGFRRAWIIVHRNGCQGERATVEEAGDGRTPPWWPDPDCWLPFSACVFKPTLCVEA